LLGHKASPQNFSTQTHQIAVFQTRDLVGGGASRNQSMKRDN
jgi:hypothetical protein